MSIFSILFLVHSKFLKDKVSYGYVYKNKDLTKNEIEEEIALRRLRIERKNELVYSGLRYKYGKTESPIEFFFWGGISGKLHRIDRTTRRTIQHNSISTNGMN